MFVGDMVLYYNKQDYVTDGTLGPIAAFVNCVGIICGGAYHSHVAYLGLIGRYDDEMVLGEVMHYMDVQKTIAFGLQGTGFLLLAVMLVCNWMVFPRWRILVSPGILFLFFPITRKLPKCLHMVISGGWTNLISVIYYAAAWTVLLMRK